MIYRLEPNDLSGATWDSEYYSRDFTEDNNTVLELLNNGSVDFQGSSQAYKSIASGSPLDIRGSHTLEAKVKPNTGFTGYNSIVSLNDGGAFSDQQYMMLLYESGGSYFMFTVIAGSYYSNQIFNLKIGEWNHFATTWDGSTITQFVNGVEIGTASHSTTPSFKSNFQIGARSDSADQSTFALNFDGEIDDVRVWSEDRSNKIYQNKFNEFTGNETNLEGYWRFNENSGSTLNDTAGTEDLTLSGTYTWYNGYAKGWQNNRGDRISPALNLGSIDDVTDSNITWTSNEPTGTNVEILTSVADTNTPTSTYKLGFDGASRAYFESTSGDSLDMRNSMTVEAWVNPDTVVGYQYIVTKNESGGFTDQQYSLGLYDTDIIVTIAGTNYTIGADVVAGRSQHIAFTWDGSTIIVYLNGEQVGTQSHSTSPSFKPWFGLGGRSDSADGTSGSVYFDGDIEMARVWNTARSGEELRQNMTKGVSITHNELAGEWRLDEGEGTTLYDSTDNNNNLTSETSAWNSGEAMEDSLIWRTATDNTTIPGINTGDNLTGKYLFVRQQLSGDDTTTPEVSSLEVEVSSETPASVNTDPETNVDYVSGPNAQYEAVATLNGEITSMNDWTEVYTKFQYRETGASTWNTVNVGTETTATTFSQQVDLTSDTQYEYRAQLENTSTGDTVEGSIITFTTPAQRPYAETDPATNVGTTSADLNAEIFHEGDYSAQFPVWGDFEYRIKGDSTWQEELGYEENVGTYTVNVTGLQDNTTYEFRAKLDETWSYNTLEFTTQTAKVTDSDNKDSTLTGELSDSSNKASKLSGEVTDSSNKDSALSAENTTSSNKDNKLTGEVTDSSNKDSNLSAEALSDSQRDVTLWGKDITQSTRENSLTGALEANDSKDSTLSAEETLSDSKDTTLTGEITENSSKDNSLEGEDNANSSRDALTAAESEDSSSQGSTLTGDDKDSSNRLSEVSGEDTAQSSRTSKIDGILGADDSRESTLKGIDTTSDSRASTLFGVLSDEDSKDSTLKGQDQESSSKDANLEGQDTIQDSKDSGLFGVQPKSSSRKSILFAPGIIDSSRTSTLRGQADDSSSRDSSLNSQEDDSSSRSSRILSPQAPIYQKRGPVYTKKDDRFSKRGPIYTKKITASEDKWFETSTRNSTLEGK